MLPTPIPDKGRVLTGLSRFWFAETAAIVPNHLLDTDPRLPVVRAAPEGTTADPAATLRGRIMLCRPATAAADRGGRPRLPRRVRLEGLPRRGAVCGIPLPAGLRESDRLPGADLHAGDQGRGGRARPEHQLRRDDRAHARPGGRVRPAPSPKRSATGASRSTATAPRSPSAPGIILADTKFEFGLAGADPADRLGRLAPTPDRPPLILIDEVMTPDSSRFWDAADYEPGRAQASFDKQFVRDWLERQPWDKTAPGTGAAGGRRRRARARRYVEAYERITGASFERYLRRT